MAKKDINITGEINHVCSRSQQKVDHEKALQVLAKAKQISRKVVFLPKGECQYSRELKQKENTQDLLISRAAAEYLMISYSAFSRRQEKAKIPFLKRNGNKKYFKISDLEQFKINNLHG